MGGHGGSSCVRSSWLYTPFKATKGKHMMCSNFFCLLQTRAYQSMSLLLTANLDSPQQTIALPACQECCRNVVILSALCGFPMASDVGEGSCMLREATKAFAILMQSA